jgi:hypothetical protein
MIDDLNSCEYRYTSTLNTLLPFGEFVFARLVETRAPYLSA